VENEPICLAEGWPTVNSQTLYSYTTQQLASSPSIYLGRVVEEGKAGVAVNWASLGEPGGTKYDIRTELEKLYM
jgi:hypothetical protein